MEYIIKPYNSRIVLPKRGYFKKGDSGEDIELIASFLAFNFLGFESVLKIKVDSMLGSYFGSNLESWIKQFQRITGLTVDGCVGSKTLSKMREYGLNA